MKICSFLTFIFFIFCIKINVYSKVITAASCSQTDVQAAIDLAADGDTVLVPAGTGIWKTPASTTPAVTIDSKAITLKGAGIGQTVIYDSTTNNSSNSWKETALWVVGVKNKPFRITGFTFTGLSDGQGLIVIRGNCENWRIDHCRFSEHGSTSIIAYGYGVIDHCTFYGSSVEKTISRTLLPSGYGETSWNTPLSLGSAQALYIEDCIFDFGAKQGDFMGNCCDAHGGARYVLRHNSVRNKNIEAHGRQTNDTCLSNVIGTVSVEAYNNTFTSEQICWVPMAFRAGTGAIFNNIVNGYNLGAINIYNDRSMASKDYCPCNGSDTIDGNEETNGYPCRDQIGRGPRDPETGKQTLEPYYQWDNTVNDTGKLAFLTQEDGLNTTHLKENRDYYNNIPRPYYTPYIYPHPLTIDQNADIISPSVPENLSGTFVGSGQINLSWDASTDNKRVTGYRIYKNGVLTDTSLTTTYSDINVDTTIINHYAISAFDATGNASVPCKPISKSLFSFTKDYFEEKQFSIYPNPATTTITIEFYTQISCETIGIYDISGRLIQPIEYKAFSQGKQVLNIDVSGFNSGIYFIKSTSGNMNYCKKLMKK